MKRLAPALLALAATGLPAHAAPAPDGQALYRRTCAVCHAAGSPGALTLGKRLGPQNAILEQRTDLTPAYIRLVVRRGLRVMPWVTAIELPDRDLDAVAAYLTRNNAFGGAAMSALTRRQTLAIGAVGATLATTPAGAAARPVMVVFDGRYSDARRFADRAALAGAESFDARRDLARFWRDLDSRPWRIVALTTPADFGLGVAGGRERGMVLQASGLHDGRVGEALDHRLDGFAQAAPRPRLDAGLDWPEALAELMLLTPASKGRGVRFQTARAADHPGTLTSWRMA